MACKLTDREIEVLKNVKPTDVVEDIRVLKKLAKMGLIELDEQTGTIVSWYGRTSRAVYISNAPFFFIESIGGFASKYFSGAFKPYLVKLCTSEIVGIFNDAEKARAFRIANENKVYSTYDAKTKTRTFYKAF